MGRFTVAAVVALWVVPLSIVVDRIVPEPYMDEIFHIPQAQRFCAGDFRSWDPMITTPPGLYFLSLVPFAALFSKPSSTVSTICSTPFLRATNGVLSIICSVLIYDILILLRPKIGSRGATLCAICGALYPVHWFFSFLYYTDVPSTAAVLAMFLASLKGRYWISSLLGAAAVIIRQTNVIWMLFIASNAAVDLVNASCLKENALLVDSAPQLMDRNVGSTGSRFMSKKELRRRFQRSAKSGDPSFSENRISLRNNPDSWHELYSLMLMTWHLKWKLLLSFFPFILVLSCFTAFVFWNGGVVLGAKEDHVVSPHFAQMMYFGLACAAATAPLHFNLTRFRNLMKSFWKKKTRGILQLAVALTVGFISVDRFSIIHPYLLADNRHYVFYFRKRMIHGGWASKYMLIPLCIYSWLSISSIAGKSTGRIWALLFFLACSATLVPAPLVEFRYYTVPIILFLLISQIDGQKLSMALTFLLFLAADVFTMWMFLFRPFQWAHQPGVLQRFIW